MTDTLRDIINEAMQANQDPEQQDTQVDAGDTDAVPAEGVAEESVDSQDEEVNETEENTETDDESDEEDSEEAGETYEVTIDGKPVEVTLKEALAGYQRQADYTRKAQALATERQEFETARGELSEIVEQVTSLDEAWGDNPVSVIAHFTAATDNPTQAVALLIKELASSNLLDKEFLDMFGITPEVRAEWSQQSEVETLRTKVGKNERAEQERFEAIRTETAVQQAIVQFDRDIDDILSDENLKLSGTARAEFRQRLASYARDNELTNLKAAYKALKYEEDSTKRKVAVKTAERAKAKRGTSAVSRKGSSGSGSPVSGEAKDLRTLILESMKENGA
tara:strand:+ start:355 stop:1365 length:1011 start_codon:yes stop_codon:yes gene_type:complete